MRTNKPSVIVDRGPWYKWTLERLGLEYRYERFKMRNKVERLFRYLKLFLSLFTIYYQAANGVNKNVYLDTICNVY
jgi:transposase-like protein